MATTRIISMHVNQGKTIADCLTDRIDYSKNPDKTQGGELISAYQCDPKTADAEFLYSKRQYQTVTGREQRHDVIAYQVRQSFKPGEITPEEANRVGYEFAERFLKGRHAFFVATHTDKKHIHNHIIWNSTTLDCKHKFRDFLGSGRAVARLSDAICTEHRLSVIADPKRGKNHYGKWLGDNAKPTHMMELLMFLIVGPACISPLMELVEFGADLRNLAVRMDQIDEVLNMQPISEGTETAPKGGAEIVFQDVSFSYQNAADPLRRMALDHLTIKIPAGSFAALVGPSGGGKSTAGQLIARFWDVESGSITIAGHDIREYSMEALMNAVAFVFQDTHIFAESVYDNIAMHRKVHREDVEKAAKAARCHDFILSLPNGYDTKLGDGGHKLSGGEAQRIAIARAILKDAPIVVLDEAMAFTDAENELALREGMAELLCSKTVLMIAHRLYSIQDADCIFVLENGQLREQGSHTELLKANGLYAHLWAIQNETESWQMKGGVSHA